MHKKHYCSRLIWTKALSSNNQSNFREVPSSLKTAKPYLRLHK